MGKPLQATQRKRTCKLSQWENRLTGTKLHTVSEKTFLWRGRFLYKVTDLVVYEY